MKKETKRDLLRLMHECAVNRRNWSVADMMILPDRKKEDKRYE